MKGLPLDDWPLQEFAPATDFVGANSNKGKPLDG